MNQNRRTQNYQPASKRPMAVRKSDELPPKKKSGCGGILAVLFLIAVVLVVVLLVSGKIPSPFEEQITPPAENLSTSTINYFITPQGYEETTPTSTQAIATPTETPLPTKVVIPTKTATPRAMAFVSQLVGTFPHTMFYSQYKCEDYLFIGGEVWDLRESPLKGLTVKLSGTYGGGTVDMSSISGEITVFGQSAFGFILDNQQIKSNSLSLQLFDEDGQALSAKVGLSISGECDGNLVLVNFKQVQDFGD